MNSTHFYPKNITEIFSKCANNEECNVCGSSRLSSDEIFDELAGAYELLFCSHCKYLRVNQLRLEDARLAMLPGVKFDLAS
mgnify:FL=1